MKTLFLLRHAKSSWKDDTLPDLERPLNARGQRAAELMSNFLKQEKVSPDLILSSCAVRARDTIDIMWRSAMRASELRFDERIYGAPLEKLVEVVAQIDKGARSALVVGHNPGLEELLQALTGKTETMPTAALAKITFKTSDWSNIVKGGALQWVVRPKDWSRA